MAEKKKSTKSTVVGGMNISWRRLAILSSVVLNIAFVVMFLTIACTRVLDGVLMPAGLSRYCSASNDDKFADSSDKVKALRLYVCDRDNAHEYFKDGLNKYYQSQNIPVTEE